MIMCTVQCLEHVEYILKNIQYNIENITRFVGQHVELSSVLHCITIKQEK